jgi:hypothetical protein
VRSPHIAVFGVGPAPISQEPPVVFVIVAIGVNSPQQGGAVTHDVDLSLPVRMLRHAATHPLGFRVTFDIIASGDEDVVTAARAAEIRAQTGAVCVAWEGSGMRANSRVTTPVPAAVSSTLRGASAATRSASRRP